MEKKIRNLSLKELQNKKLLSDEIGSQASIIAKDKNIKACLFFSKKFMLINPQKYNGSCLDGRDITYKIVPDADFKFFINANLKIRAKRRYLELKNLKVPYSIVLKY